MTSPGGLSHVDHQFVAPVRNLARAFALGARGRGEEPGGSGGRTKWSPAARRRPWRRRSVSVGDVAVARERAGEGGEVHAAQQLTRNVGRPAARVGEAGVDGEGARTAAGRAGETARFRRAEGLPARAGCPGR